MQNSDWKKNNVSSRSVALLFSSFLCISEKDKGLLRLNPLRVIYSLSFLKCIVPDLLLAFQTLTVTVKFIHFARLLP